MNRITPTFFSTFSNGQSYSGISGARSPKSVKFGDQAINQMMNDQAVASMQDDMIVLKSPYSSPEAVKKASTDLKVKNAHTKTLNLLIEQDQRNAKRQEEEKQKRSEEDARHHQDAEASEQKDAAEKEQKAQEEEKQKSLQQQQSQSKPS